MLYLSEILIQRHDLKSFADLIGALRGAAAAQRFFRMDVRPPFPDTPDDWEDRLEAAFLGIQ